MMAGGRPRGVARLQQERQACRDLAVRHPLGDLLEAILAKTILSHV